MNNPCIPRLPAEWQAQQMQIICWPHANSDWASCLDRIDTVYCELATHISHYQRVLIIVQSNAHRNHVHKQLNVTKANDAHICYSIIPSNDTWVRDNGPICCTSDRGLITHDFTFNGWGNKFPHELDNQVTHQLVKQNAYATTLYQTHPIVLEGGAIESNGLGTVLSTASCLLAKNRNPHMSLRDYEEFMQTVFDTRQLLVLQHGYLEGDDTDGHIDMLARFCNPTTLCYTQCSDPSDAHFSVLQAMENEIQQLTDQAGKPFVTLPLPLPEPCYNAQGARLPANYANFVILGEDAVLVPTYHCASDAVALNQLKQAFPHYDIIPIAARTLIEQGGGLHCATRNIPAHCLKE